MKASRTKILAQEIEYPITTSTACSTWQPGDNSFSRTRYTAVVETTLAHFNLRSNWRTFQNQTVPDIITSMLAEHPTSAAKSRPAKKVSSTPSNTRATTSSTPLPATRTRKTSTRTTNATATAAATMCLSPS